MLNQNATSSVSSSFPALPKGTIPKILNLDSFFDFPSSRSATYLPPHLIKNNLILRCSSIALPSDLEEEEEEDDDPCPVDCVREFKTEDEFHSFLEKAKQNQSLVVVDFYRRSCGSCKYIEQGFAKLCKGSGDEQASVIFLKHDVLDEYDEQSEVAERLKIKTVPLFHFYKNGALLEAFPTRDKERITAAILKYSSPAL